MVWAAVYDRGVARFDAKGGLVLGPDQGLASDRPSVVQAARDGRVFVGHHRGGIDVVLGRSVAPHERSADLPRAAVTALLETADGALWVGTQGGGLAILRGADLRALTTTDGLADDNVNGLYEAADGAIWVATAGGLSRVLGDAVVNIGRSQGLPAGAVYDVLQDRGGDFWLSTDVGVISVERESVDRLLAGGVGRIESRHFGTAEGMLTAECVGGTQENMAKDRDGTIYVATTRGVALVSPSMAPSPPSAPRSLLSALWVGGRRAPLPSEGEASVLGRGPTDVALEYLSTAHLRQSDVRFRYRLEGLDED
jgi:ligand-binding sensor domain-containing protein